MIFKVTGLEVEKRRGVGMNFRAMVRDQGEETEPAGRLRSQIARSITSLLITFFLRTLA